MAQVGTSGRNFYDRYYLNAHDRTGEVFLVSGFGVHPNLGVLDAFVTVRHRDTKSARCGSPTRWATGPRSLRSATTESR